MTNFFTSDTHFGHARIVELCNRPFAGVEEMNDAIVNNWNSRVRPEDTVYHLGDVALGPIMESLTNIRRLNGHKILIVGNHDRPFPPMQKGKQDEIDKWVGVYEDAGFSEVLPAEVITFGDNDRFMLSHFPYDGDSHDEERYSDYRLRDGGLPLVHGHTHSRGNPVSRSKTGSLQIHVGMDAWGFRPVPEETVLSLIRNNS